MEKILELEKISVFFERRGYVLKDLSLDVFKGEKIGIKGANGSGKTTLLFAIEGFVKISDGKIKLFGKEMISENDFKEPRKKIGFLFQNSDDQLFSPTVEDDIAFGPLNLGWDRNKIREKVDEIIEYFGIEHLRKRFSHTLSFGEKKIVSIASIVVMEPELYLLDEPTSALDEETAEKVKNFIASKNETFIIVSHYIDFIENICDKIYLLSDGKLEIM